MGVPSIETHVESVESDNASSYIDMQPTELASMIKKETSWYFDPENLKPGAPGWKLEREIHLLLEACERRFPQATRLRLLRDSAIQPPIWGSERLRGVCPENQSELASAESSSFRACALRAMIDPPPIIGIDGEPVAESFALDPEAYEEASSEEKARLLCDVHRRFMIWHAISALSPGFHWQFPSRVTEDWLHMLALNGKFPEAMCCVPLPEWYAENFILEEDDTHDRIQYYLWLRKVTDNFFCKEKSKEGHRRKGANES
ncbi:hypothetical protein QFC20_003618 [Naganishia adeliensis]|uniref:Uncharacterized protein n=1 Tax=Naganishia adeliensis TaxID=92952 RepID=A0ACC2WA04_9TREE|nr:hypothetical protein QFC20_003618 [Naganishia adeliensis]